MLQTMDEKSVNELLQQGNQYCKDVKAGKYFAKYLKGDKFIVGFSVDTINPAGNTLENEQWLDQILSTFKFL